MTIAPGFLAFYAGYPALREQIVEEVDRFKQLLNELFVRNYETFKKRDDPDQLIQVLKELKKLNEDHGERNIADVCSCEITSLCSRQGPVVTDIFAQAEQGNIATLREHIIQDPSIVNVVRDGNSLLHVAAANGHFNLARLLMRHGAEVTLKDRKGRQPRKLAELQGHHCLKDLLGNPFFFVKDLKENKNAIELKKYLRQEGELNEKVDRIFGLKSDTKVVSFLNARVAYGRDYPLPPIHLAAKEKKFDVVELLLTYGANPNAVDGKGNSPLHVLILQQDPTAEKIALLILNKGGALELKNHEGQSPFDLISRRPTALSFGIMNKAKRVYRCVIEKKIEDLTKALTEKPIVTAVWGPQRKSPLAEAIGRGGLELTRKLIEYEPALIDIPDGDGNNPLHLAALAGNTDAVQFFLEQGARMEDKNIKGQTPQECNPDISSLRLATLLMQDCLYLGDLNKDEFFADEEDRQHAIGPVFQRVSEYLYDPNARSVINARNALDKTLLHLLCEVQRTPHALLQMVVDLGACLNVRNFRGSNPLHNIAYKWKERSVEALDLLYKKFGNEVKQCMQMIDEQEQKTPPMIAAMNSHLEFIQWAAERKMIDFNAIDQHGNTIFLLACGSPDENAKETLAFLLDHGCDLKAHNQHGYTGLLKAAEAGNIPSIHFLLAKGASVRDKNNKKRNLLHCLAREGTFEQILSFFDQGNLGLLQKSFPLELFQEKDNDQENFLQTLAHNKNLKPKQSHNMQERGVQLAAMLESFVKLLTSEGQL